MDTLEDSTKNIEMLNALSVEQTEKILTLIKKLKTLINSSNYEDFNDLLEYITVPIINDLSETEIQNLEKCLTSLKQSITKLKQNDFVRYCAWLELKLDFNLKAKQQETQRQLDEKHLHPIRPRRGEVYLTQLGQNIGKEINDEHLVLILQNNKGNSFSNTVVVIPISSSGKLYDSHEKIEQKDIKSGRLDKLPSKAKTEQIHFIDKARLIHKVAVFEDDAINRIVKRLKKNLDIT